jgi:hypothetical protein
MVARSVQRVLWGVVALVIAGVIVALSPTKAVADPPGWVTEVRVPSAVG